MTKKNAQCPIKSPPISRMFFCHSHFAGIIRVWSIGYLDIGHFLFLLLLITDN